MSTLHSLYAQSVWRRQIRADVVGALALCFVGIIHTEVYAQQASSGNYTISEWIQAQAEPTVLHAPQCQVTTTFAAIVGGQTGSPNYLASFTFLSDDFYASSGVVFCPGDGTGTTCPCANHSSTSAGQGCLHSFGTGGELRAMGFASISNDTLVLRGTQMPNGPALYFQGSAQQNGGLGIVLGDGLACATGTIVRLGTKANASGASQYPETGDLSIAVVGLLTTPGVRTYQVWFRDPAAFCTASTFNLTNGVEIAWTP